MIFLRSSRRNEGCADGLLDHTLGYGHEILWGSSLGACRSSQWSSLPGSCAHVQDSLTWGGLSQTDPLPGSALAGRVRSHGQRQPVLTPLHDWRGLVLDDAQQTAPAPDEVGLTVEVLARRFAFLLL